MKLLSWMHRKLQSDNTGSYKGSSCLLQKPLPNNQENYAKPHSYSKERNQQQNHCQSYLDGFTSETDEEINKEMSSKIFPGFLTIGTLSFEPITTPGTPTFDMDRQKENENDIQYNLKVINDELEKFLKEEAIQEGSGKTSGRKSQVSTITLIDKEGEEDVNTQVIVQSYPLKGYLLGSSPEPEEAKQKDQDGAMYLQEPFESNRTAQGRSNIKDVRSNEQTKKEPKSSTELVTKILRSFQPSSKRATASKEGENELPPKMTTIKKIKKLFDKKVHPETNSDTKDPHKFSNCKPKKILKNSGHNSPNLAHSRETNRMSCWGTLVKDENRRLKSDKQKSRDAATIPPKEKNSIGGWEHWINTDSDYLVLELQKNEDGDN